MSKNWLDWLFDLLAGARTEAALEAAGARPGDPALTLAVPIPMTGYTAPVPPPGVKESRDLALLHPELQRRYALVKAAFQAQTGRQLFETCTWRSPARQAELYQVGRRGVPGEKPVTNCDGVQKKSRHNVFPSEAVDVCVDTDPGPGKHPVWDYTAYAPLGPLALQHGLRWGGDWNGNGIQDEKLLDTPHLELPAEAA